MNKKYMLLILVIGMLLSFSVAAASTPYGVYEDPPPRPGGGECDLNEWEVRVIEKLAKRYDVTTDEITHWYCMEYDFGQIAFAYEISSRTDYKVEEIFVMYDNGLTWIEILEEVGLHDWFPSRWRGPFPVPPRRPMRGENPIGDFCLENGSNQSIEKL